MTDPRDLARAAAGDAPKAVVRWMPRSRTPALRWRGGDEAEWWVGHALLKLQLAEGEPLAINPEAVTLGAGLDPESARRWARVAFDAWLQWGAPARDHAVLPLLVALGGDAMVPALAAATTHWHREGRRAMAEGAAQLLAMLGSDEALRALDALSAEHPHDALGAAVTAALEAEAQARGEPVDDLLDGCAPRFGLALDGAAELTDGRRRFRVTLVGWKPSLTDEVGRELHAPPKASRPDARREAVVEAWRELSHELEPTRRRERRRAEDALVNQRVWEAATWTARVASHPVLARVYEGLVWVTDGGEGFTWSASGGARGPDGEAVALASVKALRLAHPAVDGALLARWGGAALGPPFAQREREVEPVEGVTSRFEGRVMRAHDDRHDRHAQPWDREGWRVGPIEDHRFNALTWRVGRGVVEASLAVGGMVRWAADAREATVGALTFRRASTGDAIDPRDAPPVFVSEAAASVARMLR